MLALSSEDSALTTQQDVCIYRQSNMGSFFHSFQKSWARFLCESDKAFIHPLKSVIILLYSEAIVICFSTIALSIPNLPQYFIIFRSHCYLFQHHSPIYTKSSSVFYYIPKPLLSVSAP